MIIFWRIKYLDRNDRTVKHRDLFLDTATLPAATRAAVELAIETQSNRTAREFLKFRPLFAEDNSPNWAELQTRADKFNSFMMPESYWEDENGNEISQLDIGPIITGDPNMILAPNGAQPHDIEFMLSKPAPIPIAEVNLSPDELAVLGYFIRDFRELAGSALLRDGPGSITSLGTPNPVLTTAVTEEEIRSALTIFRRLYMSNEPANFPKAARVYLKAVGNHPSGKWIAEMLTHYEAKLAGPLEARPFVQPGSASFTSKRLIDVFLYTRFAHQPDERRQRQYEECLNQLKGKTGLLTWLFLTEVWKYALEIVNAGRVIARWFEGYCQHHQVTPDILSSIAHENPGLGSEEKEAARNERLFREKVEALAKDLWAERGSPAGGHLQFLSVAKELLRNAL